MIFKRILGIAACDPHGVMGKNGKLPWHCPEELEHFADTTSGSPMIMGHNTFLTLPTHYFRTRTTIIFTHRKPQVHDPNQCFVSSIPEFLSINGTYTEVSSRIGFWAGSKRRKSIKKKRVVLNNTTPLFFNRFAAAFNPAKKPILELTSVYQDLYVIGGAQIYSLFLRENLISEFIVTKMTHTSDGDTFFPLSLLNGWSEQVLRKTPLFTIHRYLNPQEVRACASKSS